MKNPKKSVFPHSQRPSLAKATHLGLRAGHHAEPWKFTEKHFKHRLNGICGDIYIYVCIYIYADSIDRLKIKHRQGTGKYVYSVLTPKNMCVCAFPVVLPSSEFFNGFQMTQPAKTRG